jgi:ribonuclease HI
VLIEDDQGIRLRALHRYIGVATNNQAEYRALIEGLTALKDWAPDRVEIYLDSKLVVEQVKGMYKTRMPELQTLHAEAMRLLEPLKYEIKHVRREENRGTDKLVNMALDAIDTRKKLGR